MSPYHNSRYADFLYWTGLLDAKQRDECLVMEAEMEALLDSGEL